MKTLIAHEWLAPIGGSENVFESLTQSMPHADTACLWNDAPDRFQHVTRETWLSGSPLRRSKPLALPAMPFAWARLPIAEYGRVIASSHAFAHQLATRAARSGAQGFVYVHTPARYIWAPAQDHRGRTPLVRAASGPLRQFDRRHTSAAVSYAANSNYIRDRIRSAWGRESRVIYPPVQVEQIKQHSARAQQLTDDDLAMLERLPPSFVLGASRLVAYKRLDKVLEVGRGLRLPVVIAGSGPDEARLRGIAEDLGTPVFFVGRLSDLALHELYRRAALFVFLAVEDFGIMPVEAMAAGTPVLVNTTGGAKEAVATTGGGVAVDLAAGPTELRRAAASALSLDMVDAADKTSAFSARSFTDRVKDWLTA